MVPRTRRLDDPYCSPVLLQARRLAWAHGALARVVLMEGDPVAGILAAASELRVDLIVIGGRPSRQPAVIAAPTRYRRQRGLSIQVIAASLQCSRLPWSLARRARVMAEVS